MTADEAELKELMLAGLEGDAVAHRRLLSQVSRYLRGYYRTKLSQIGRGPTEAEDLVQEVLLAIHTRRHTYDPDQPVTPWLHAIARYKLIDHLRRTKEMLANVPLGNADDVADQEDHTRVESSYDLQKLLSKLPEKMRRAIQCVKIDGLSVADAAQRCGISESAVKVNVHRGLRALAALIRREEAR